MSVAADSSATKAGQSVQPGPRGGGCGGGGGMGPWGQWFGAWQRGQQQEQGAGESDKPADVEMGDDGPPPEAPKVRDGSAAGGETGQTTRPGGCGGGVRNDACAANKVNVAVGVTRLTSGCRLCKLIGDSIQ